MFHLLELLFPLVCASCSRALPRKNQLLCDFCYSELNGRYDEMGQTHPVERVFWGRCQYEAATALVPFIKGGMSQLLLHKLKYSGYSQLGGLLGECLARKVRDSGRFTALEGIIPVPMMAAKQRKRGYNQAQLIAEGIASVLDLPIVENYLVKDRQTDSQTKKGRWDRMINSQGAFRLRIENTPRYQHLLLVDDVITTGATLISCTQLLTGSHKVSLASIAYQ